MQLHFLGFWEHDESDECFAQTVFRYISMNVLEFTKGDSETRTFQQHCCFQGCSKEPDHWLGGDTPGAGEQGQVQGAVPPLEEVKSGSAGPDCQLCLSCSSWGHRWGCPGVRELYSLLSSKILFVFLFQAV